MRIHNSHTILQRFEARLVFTWRNFETGTTARFMSETGELEESFESQLGRGIDLFNRQEFFDCHDVIEELWMEERGEKRLFLQGLIQSSVGCYHLTNGNTTGAISQYSKALDKLVKYPADYLGVRNDLLVSELGRLLAGAEAMRDEGLQYEVHADYFPKMYRIGEAMNPITE